MHHTQPPYQHVTACRPFNVASWQTSNHKQATMHLLFVLANTPPHSLRLYSAVASFRIHTCASQIQSLNYKLSVGSSMLQQHWGAFTDLHSFRQKKANLNKKTAPNTFQNRQTIDNGWHLPPPARFLSCEEPIRGI